MGQFGGRGQFTPEQDAVGHNPLEFVLWNTPGAVIGANIIPGVGGALRLMNDQENPAVVIGIGVNGPTGITSDGTGGIALRPGVEPAPDDSELRLYSPDGTDFIRIINGSVNIHEGSTLRATFGTNAGIGSELIFFSDAIVTEEGRITPAANSLILSATGGAALAIQSDQGAAGARLEIPAGANASPSVTADGSGGASLRSSDLSDLFVADISAGGTRIVRNGTVSVGFEDTETDFENLATKSVIFYNTDVDERWRIAPALLAGQPEAPADGTLSNSPTIRLRIYNDPVGGPALESFDYTVQYREDNGGGTLDVDTEVVHTIRGVPAFGLIHDEGQNECLLRLPTWTGNVAGLIAGGTVNGCIFYDPGGVAGQRFKGVHAGALVNLG